WVLARLGGQGRKADKAVFSQKQRINQYIYIVFYHLPCLLSPHVYPVLPTCKKQSPCEPTPPPTGDAPPSLTLRRSPVA
ncbi:MAG: hypothetical protein PUP91_39055, partial [Rhizonema sp. PD37]|nr:hypothetical protein [Rhizonema sp. PD37]